MKNNPLLITGIIITFIFTHTLSTGYEKLTNWDNTHIITDHLTYDGTHFTINNNKKISPDTISHIVFNLSQSNQTKATTSPLGDISPQELLDRASLMEKKYPDASALILHDTGIQQLNRDGTRFTHSRYAMKIMNEKALGSAILSFYEVEGKYENLILMARSIAPDGTISLLNPNDITSTAPRQGLEYFSGRKGEKIIKAIIPNVKVGSIIDYEWKISELSPEDETQFYTRWYFGGQDPVHSSSVKFIIPVDKQLYWVVNNFSPFNEEPEINESNEYKTYSFFRGECPPIIPEPFSPPTDELLPLILGSTLPDQTYLSTWLAQMFDERMKATELMELVVYDVLEDADAQTDDEITAALYRFVQEYIHYRSIKSSISSGYSGHPAPETFENRYGDCIDKSILFATLLQLAGIEAYPVIIMTNDRARPLYNEIGVMQGNHAITEIHLKNKIIYLDSTSTTYRYPSFRLDDQHIPAWNPILNTVREIEPIDPIWNTQTYYKDIKIDKNGNGQIINYSRYSGDTEANLRNYFQSLKPKQIVTVLSTLVSQDYPGSILRKYNYTDPTDYSKNLSLTFAYHARSIARKTGDFYILTIPVTYNFEYISLNTRKYPLTFQTTDGKQNKLSIQLPDGYTVIDVPKSLNIYNDNFSYTGKYTIIGKDKILFEDHFERKSCKILPEDYEKFREELLKIDHFIKTPLIIEKKD